MSPDRLFFRKPVKTILIIQCFCPHSEYACLQSNENLTCPTYMFPVEAELGNTFCLLVSALTLQRSILLSLFRGMFFALLLVISLFKMAPTGQVLSSVSKGPKGCAVPQKRVC